MDDKVKRILIGVQEAEEDEKKGEREEMDWHQQEKDKRPLNSMGGLHTHTHTHTQCE